VHLLSRSDVLFGQPALSCRRRPRIGDRLSLAIRDPQLLKLVSIFFLRDMDGGVPVPGGTKPDVGAPFGLLISQTCGSDYFTLVVAPIFDLPVLRRSPAIATQARLMANPRQ